MDNISPGLTEAPRRGARTKTPLFQFASSVSPRDIALALDPSLVHRHVLADQRVRFPPRTAEVTGKPRARRDHGLNPDNGNARMLQPEDDDETVRLPRPGSRAQAPERLPVWALVAPPVALVLAVMVGWLVWSRSTVPPGAAPPAREAAAPPARGFVIPEASQSAPAAPNAAATQTPPVNIAAASNMPAAPNLPQTIDVAASVPIIPMIEASPVPRTIEIETANEQHILNHVATGGEPPLKVFRFTANPRILVLDFVSLRQQAQMLNRAAALVEKAGLPHDRLLSEAELNTAVRASGDTVETFYYGHDYSASSLARFFSLAARDEVRLTEDEHVLDRLIRQEGWFDKEARGGLISIPRAGADEHVTPGARATILHHELSHGEYFTNPAYMAFVHRFWTQTLTLSERDRIRRHLQSLGYDSGLEEVMENEAQAYLIFTDNPEFFTPGMIGMSKARLTELRSGFYHAMPQGWLRDSLGQSINPIRPASVSRP